MEKLIINVALTGIIPTKRDNPNLPVTPEEIARDCEQCFNAGARIFHLHARDSEGQASCDPEIYGNIISLVRKRCPEAIICVSTSGRRFREFSQRAAVLDLEGDLKPDMASLTLGSHNFPREASVNAPEMIKSLALRMQERGIVPELEIFDFGMIDYAWYLIRKGIIREPFYFNLILGSLGTASATPYNLAAMVRSLPSGACWAGGGLGRFQFYVNCLAIAMGGHVRVGLEDNLYLDTQKEHLATNLLLVERLVKVARAMERDLASPQEAREILGLPPRAIVASHESTGDEKQAFGLASN